MTAPAPLHTDVADAPEGGAAVFAPTRDGKRLRFALWRTGGKGTVLIFPGRTEYVEKYGPVVTRLAALGLSTVVIDWRGQGLSTRPGDSTGLGHVDDYDEYQEDIDTVLWHPEMASMPRPFVMLAHSMGGCIGLRALHSRLPVEGAIFSAPMWGLNLSPMQGWAAERLASAFVALGLGGRHVPGASDRYYISETPFERNVLTRSEARWSWLKRQLELHPDLGLGGPSLGWTLGAIREGRALMRKLPPRQPTLTLLGSEEAVVSGDTIRGFHAKEGSGRLIVVEGGRHEILMDDGPRLETAWAAIEEFLYPWL